MPGPTKRKRQKQGAKTSRVKKSKTSLDEQLKQTFQSYEEDGIIDDDNLLRFVTDLEIEPDDVVLLVLCEHMGCETGGTITWSEFERGMKSLHCVNIGDVKERLDNFDQLRRVVVEMWLSHKCVSHFVGYR